MKKFKVTVEASLKVNDAEKLDEFKLYLYNQNGEELEVAKVQAVEELPYKLEGRNKENG